MSLFANELSMTETLFGGLAVAAVLFFVVRKVGLSNFWAGILSGVLPFIAYIAYSTQHWPGGDVPMQACLLCLGACRRKKRACTGRLSSSSLSLLGWCC